MSAILTISELTRALRGQIEEKFAYVWVRGQATNVSRPASGHVYFSLRDEEASLACVWFKPRNAATPLQQRFDPLTGEVFEDGPRQSLAERLENGQEIICSGRMSVYAPRGAYQLIVEFGQEAGVGKLHAEFEALKAQLAALGYFDTARKRPLPAAPQRVAVVTSPAAAALQDFLRITSSCGAGASIRIYPTPVQGADAPPQIVAALHQVAADNWAQVCVLIRGGGSLEDLWAFNDPAVAKAVLDSPIPVLAGIGHEVDSTLADLTADVRAATPTHAGHLLWPARLELMQRLDESTLALQRYFSRQLDACGQKLDNAARALAWFSPHKKLERGQETLRDLTQRLCRAANDGLLAHERQLNAHGLRLDAAFGPRRLREYEAALDLAYQRLVFTAQRHADTRHAALEHAHSALAGLDPMLPLRRGYSMAFDEQGHLVRSIEQAARGSSLRIRVADGAIAATVSDTRPETVSDTTKTPADT